MHHFYRPKNRNNSLIRDQKSNKHIANGYKKLVHTFKREAVQFFVAKNLAVNHLPLEALPAVQTWTAICKSDRKAVVTWYFGVCGFPSKNLMLKVSNKSIVTCLEQISIITTLSEISVTLETIIVYLYRLHIFSRNLKFLLTPSATFKLTNISTWIKMFCLS